MDLTALRASARRKVSFQTSASAKYGTTDLDANLNEWYRLVVSWVVLATGIWEFQGEVSTANLVMSQNEYVLPTGLIALNRVELLYPNQSDYVTATRIDDKQVEIGAFGNGEIPLGTESSPVFRVFDNSVFIYPAPSAAVTNGIRIELIEDLTDLSSSSDSPNLNPLIHRVLSLGAAYDYLVTTEAQRKASSYYNQIFGAYEGDKRSLKSQIEALAAQRDRTTKPRIIPRAVSYK